MTKLIKSLEDRFPEIAARYNHELNDRKLSTIAPFSGYKAWWNCDKGHSWFVNVSALTANKQGCSVCAGWQVWEGFNDLASRFPKVAAEWDYFANDKTPEKIAHGTHERINWVCQAKGHKWNVSVFHRTNTGNNCPYCSGKKILAGYNDFLTLQPLLAKEWDFVKNDKDPSTLGGKSHYKAWWICPAHSHSYPSNIKSRSSRNDGCPYCSNRKILVGFNDIATTAPQLMAEWDYKKNTIDPLLIPSGHSNKVYWLCKEGHSWKTSPSQRTFSLTRCPECVKSDSSLIEETFRNQLHTISCLSNISEKLVKLPWSEAKRGSLAVDATAYIEALDKTLIFEYDGGYWHGITSPNVNAINKDIEKTEYLLSRGYIVVRVRQTPLENLPIDNPCLIQLPYKSTHSNKTIPETVERISSALGLLLEGMEAQDV